MAPRLILQVYMLSALFRPFIEKSGGVSSISEAVVKGWRPTSQFLPLFNSVFATAFTFLGTSLPNEHTVCHLPVKLEHAITIYVLAASTVLLYW